MPKYVYIADSDVCISTVLQWRLGLPQQYDKRAIAANCAARIILYCWVWHIAE